MIQTPKRVWLTKARAIRETQNGEIKELDVQKEEKGDIERMRMRMR